MNRGQKIVVDAGHGGNTPAGRSSAYGARGPRGTQEKDVVLALARRVEAHYGSDIVLTRRSDVNLPLADRMAVAHRYGAPVFLSLHANQGPAGACGSEAYVHECATAQSFMLAESIQRELGAHGHAVAPVGSEQLAILSPDRLPPGTAACLLEVDYLSDPGGEQRLTDPASLDRIGSAIARGIRRYMGGQPAHARGQIAPALIVGIIGAGIGAFSLINSVEQRASGGLTWHRNITKVTHTYPSGTTPNAWVDCSDLILHVDGISGLSSAWAMFETNWRANGNDIEQCLVEKYRSSDWTISALDVTFEGVDAASYEQNSVGCILMHIEGHLDPAGSGDIDFHGQVLIKADGTMVNQGDLEISRGDASDFNIRALDSGYGFFIQKR
jgi:N-acetylmuramoyl-L-alanine amidase